MNNHSKCGLLPLCLGLVGLAATMLSAAPKVQEDKPAFPKVTTPLPLASPPRSPRDWAQQKKGFEAVTNNAWVRNRWTGNDRPFLAMRTEVEQAFATAAQPQDLVSRYEAIAKKQPNNALAQFAWGYAVRLALRSSAYHVSNPTDYLDSAIVALAETPAPNTYNYDRLRYLLWFQLGGGWASHFMRGMGDRLLQKDPKDFPVLLDQAMIFTQNDDAYARQHGYILIQRLVKEYPSNPSVYDALACWYDTQYYFKHDTDDYRNAIASYQKAFNMYPVTSARRAQLPGVIQFVNQQHSRISGG